LGAATTIVNAKVFDGTKSQDWTSVRFADGLITKCSVASAAQEGDEVIDAGGGTVLPGLIDAHVHLVPGAIAAVRSRHGLPVVTPFVNAEGKPENGPYPCPCCGFVTLGERSAFEICPVCFWEDDGQDDHEQVDAGCPRRPCHAPPAPATHPARLAPPRGQ
jgi:hypothetical protein